MHAVYEGPPNIAGPRTHHRQRRPTGQHLGCTPQVQASLTCWRRHLWLPGPTCAQARFTMHSRSTHPAADRSPPRPSVACIHRLLQTNHKCRAKPSAGGAAQQVSSGGVPLSSHPLLTCWRRQLRLHVAHRASTQCTCQGIHTGHMEGPTQWRAQAHHRWRRRTGQQWGHSLREYSMTDLQEARPMAAWGQAVAQAGLKFEWTASIWLHPPAPAWHAWRA
jgi:hypothetical protein